MTTPSFSSRRAFLKAAAATAAAAPFILPSRAWSAEVKPNSRLSLGFIGTGKQAQGLMAGFLKMKEFQTVAVCDVDSTRRTHAQQVVNDTYAKEAGGSYAGCTAYIDFRELLSRKDIDAVVIATPDHWHALIAIAAAKAGKDIYCEKPLSQSIHEARAMVEATRRNKRVFQVGSMQRSSREFRVACELVQNGVLGKVQKVQVGVGGPAIPCNLPGEDAEPGLDWNMWLGPAPERAYNSVLSPRGVHTHFPHWRDYREYGGGGVTDWGAHHFDIAQWGLGMQYSGPTEIYPAAAEDAVSGVRFRYANGVEMFHITENGVTFTGTDGELFVNRGKIRLTLNGVDKAKFIDKKDKPALADQLDLLEKEFLSNPKIRLYSSNDHKVDWLQSIKARKPPIADVEIGARSVTVCHLANLAYYHHEALKWNPKREEFTGGTGKSAWLDVAYRGPWKLEA